jgi:hypothetical protein
MWAALSFMRTALSLSLLLFSTIFGFAAMPNKAGGAVTVPVQVGKRAATCADIAAYAVG